MMDEQAAVASLSLHVVLHPIFKEVSFTALFIVLYEDINREPLVYTPTLVLSKHL